jgi:hypothetical protein
MRVQKKERVIDRWKIMIYIPRTMTRKLVAEANRRQQSYGATVVEILQHYFGEQEVSKPDAAQPAAQ